MKPSKEKKRKVLIVDDNRDLCEMLKDVLEMENFKVDFALNGAQAVQLMRAMKFDVVLLDIKMPGMDGIQTYEKLKALAPNVPVIMITAYAVEELIKEAMNLGAFAALKKPFDFEELLETIDKATGR